MGIDLAAMKNKAADLVGRQGGKIEAGAGKAGELAKSRFGHDERVDQVVDKIQDAIPDKPSNQR